MDFFAHSPADKSKGPPEGWQLLSVHLQAVAKLANRFAEEALPNDSVFSKATFAAGLLHDIGKYQREFQDYLRAAVKGVPQKRIPHAPVAAVLATSLLKALAHGFAPAGHHQGLPNPQVFRRYQKEWGEIADQIWDDAKKDCPDLKELGSLKLPQDIATNPLRADVFIRMLFSCLVDADWSDINAWKTDRYPYIYDPVSLLPGARLDTLQKHVEQKPRESDVHILRGLVFKNCLASAETPRGFFTLTVPTGGGKTLASLAFALKHSEFHEKTGGPRRIVYVIPYLNILEQTANVFYEALQINRRGPVVFEHHSLAYSDRPGRVEPGKEQADEGEAETPRRRRMEENWEAPIVITTSVQFFESLFSNRPAAARKLHNIARSVVIFDECQTFPEGLYRPTLAMLQELVSNWGITFVFCTATQPAVRQETTPGHGIPSAAIHEIMVDPSPQKLFQSMHRLRTNDQVPRVHVTWPVPKDKRLTWSELAGNMRDKRQALGIVNIKAHARHLFEQLGGRAGPDCPEEVFYLSTLMCAEHRRTVLREIKRRLDPMLPLNKRTPCFVASTQLVEAGVDFDFPAAFRAFGPLDAIGQAGGRCNREGTLTDENGRAVAGSFVVFRPSLDKGQSEYPGAQITEELFQEAILRGRAGPDIFDPKTYQGYFAKLVARLDTDERDIESFRTRLDFPTVATLYKLIDDITEQVIVPFGRDDSEESRLPKLVAEVRSRGFVTMELARKLQPYLVNLWPKDFQRARFGKPRLVQEIAEGWWEWIGRYDPRCGLMFDIDVLPVV